MKQHKQKQDDIASLIPSFRRLCHDSSPRAVYQNSKQNSVLKGLHFGQRKLLLSEVEYISLHLMQDKLDDDEQKKRTSVGEATTTNDKKKPLLYVYAGSANGSHLPFLFNLFQQQTKEEESSSSSSSVDKYHLPTAVRFILVDPAPFCDPVYQLARTSGARIIRGANAFDRVPTFPETLHTTDAACSNSNNSNSSSTSSCSSTGDTTASGNAGTSGGGGHGGHILEIVNDFCSDELCARIDAEYAADYRIHLISDVRLGDPKSMTFEEANAAVRRDNDLQLSWLKSMPRAESAMFKYHPPYPTSTESSPSPSPSSTSDSHKKRTREGEEGGEAEKKEKEQEDIKEKNSSNGDQQQQLVDQQQGQGQHPYEYVDGTVLLGIWSPKSSTEVRLVVTPVPTNSSASESSEGAVVVAPVAAAVDQDQPQPPVKSTPPAPFLQSKVWDMKCFEEQCYYYNTTNRYRSDCQAEAAVWGLYVTATDSAKQEESSANQKEKKKRIAELSAAASNALGVAWFLPLPEEEDDIEKEAQNSHSRSESCARLGALLKDVNKTDRLSVIAPFVSVKRVLGLDDDDAHVASLANNGNNPHHHHQRTTRQRPTLDTLPEAEKEFWSYCTPERLRVYYCWQPWHARLIPRKGQHYMYRKNHRNNTTTTTTSTTTEIKRDIHNYKRYRMQLDNFCTSFVPDFTPLGGNRPDCAVVMAAAVSLVDDPSLLLLPPDVLDTAMAATCATVIIRSASNVVPPPHGCDRGGRLSCRLEIECEAALDRFRNPPADDSFEEYNMPWRNFDTVYLQISLPDSITSCPSDFLNCCFSLATVDLRNTKLQSVGDYFLYECTSLKEVYLPDTLHTVGDGLFALCSSLATVDLRHTKLQSVGDEFLYECTSLKVTYLPDTLMTIGNSFLRDCGKLVSIDLRNTKLESVGHRFLASCTCLAEVYLPETLHTVADDFFIGCSSLVSIDLRHTKLQSVGSGFLFRCEALEEVHLPHMLVAVGDFALCSCRKLVSIDLRNTKLHTAGIYFLYECERLEEVHLPDTLQTVGGAFLEGGNRLPQGTIASVKRSIEERASQKS